MKTTLRTLWIGALGIAVGCITIHAGEKEVAATPESGLNRALAHGTPMADLRLRYEYGASDDKEAAHAATARLRLGYKTDSYHGVSALVEFEGTRAADVDDYNAGGVMGNPDKTVIADPESTELNRFHLDWSGFESLARIGRQRIILGNARFVGNVGWRQNEQTFDAALVQTKPIAGLTLSFAYVDKVNRIFGSESSGAQRRFDAQSHLFDARYDLGPLAQLGVYGYLLDLENADALSSATFGAVLNGSWDATQDITLTYHGEYARQNDYADNPASYTVDYAHLQAVASRGRVSLGVGVELLGAEQTGVDSEGQAAFASFTTPLATLHKFNGFADRFLTTPPRGLEDVYGQLCIKLPHKMTATMIYHHFDSYKDSVAYGDEIDAVLAVPVNRQLALIGKYADFRGDALTDVERFSVECSYIF